MSFLEFLSFVWHCMRGKSIRSDNLEYGFFGWMVLVALLLIALQAYLIVDHLL